MHTQRASMSKPLVRILPRTYYFTYSRASKSDEIHATIARIIIINLQLLEGGEINSHMAGKSLAAIFYKEYAKDGLPSHAELGKAESLTARQPSIGDHNGIFPRYICWNEPCLA